MVRIALTWRALAWIALPLLVLTVSAEAAPMVGGCPVFPTDHIWNVRVDGLPVRAGSDTLIETIGASTGLHPDFGSGIWPPDTGGPIGIPYDLVDGAQPLVPVSFFI